MTLPSRTRWRLDTLLYLYMQHIAFKAQDQPHQTRARRKTISSTGATSTVVTLSQDPSASLNFKPSTRHWPKMTFAFI